MSTPYSKVDHSHCPSVNSPCGFQGTHRCCLCGQMDKHQEKATSPSPRDNEEAHSTDKCYLTYTDELEGGGYLTCTYNHKEGEECLMHNDEYNDYNHGNSKE